MASVPMDSPVVSLALVLIQTFSALGLGFLCVRAGFIDIARGDMGALRFYIGQIGLPLLVFEKLAKTCLSSLRWEVILACSMGKLMVYVATFALTYFGYNTRRKSSGSRLITATSFAFFTCASNDLAIGFPVLHALYGDAKDLYVVANLFIFQVIFQPVSLIFFELFHAMKLSQEGSPEAAAAGKRETLGKALKGIMQNMIILATVAGYVYQLLFGKEGIIVATVVEDSTTGKMVLPHPLEDIIATWTAPFTMMFLFLNGTLLTSARIRFWPTLLAVMKVVLCAYFAYAFASWFGAGDMADFSFFYGTIPTGGAPLMFAAKFDSPTMPIVASASLFCLLLAAPIEMTTALFLGPGADTIIDHGLLSSTCKNMAIASLICGALVLLLLLLSSGDRALAEAMSSLRRPRPKNHRSMLVYTVAILSYSALTVALHKDELCDNGMFQNLFGFLQNIVNLMTMFMFYSTNIAQPSTTAAYTGVAITIIFISGVVALLMPYFNTWYDLCGTHTPFRAFRLAAFWNMACLAVIVSIAIWGVVKRQRSHRRSQEGRSQEITNLSLSELFEAPLSARQGSRQRSSEPRAKKNRRCGAVLTVTVMYTIRLLMMITMALQRSSGERETESGFTPMFLFTIMMEHGQGVVLLLTVLFQEEYREHFARACRQLEAAGFAPQVPAEVLGDAHSFIAAAAATAAIADANEECSPSGEDSRRQSLDSSELFRGIGAA
eukprot:TRINITY_DN4616_c0_g1_i2.p1 TRINITY_DN4616_c0_g1~~TRINITY_DN4616_c0_g1_i2.p1  ORF type:complete len:721 (+),score=130.13 TRINITY_DN4616_c0_g1_i2:242-2404(+)